MIGSKAEDYPRSIKVISLADQYMCNNKFFLRAVPPDDMLEAKELYTEIVIELDTSVVDLADRKITKFGVATDAPGFILDSPATLKLVDKEFIADGSGLIHIVFDLTPYMVSTTGDNWIYIELPDGVTASSDYGTILLWKIDLVHTTENVRSKRA